MNHLNDDELERLGLIKEIDTLSIINKASEVKEKRLRVLYIIAFVLMMISALCGQIIFVKLFGINKNTLISIGIYIIASIGILILFLRKGEENIC